MKPTQDQTIAHSAQCFLVTCMDFRLIDDAVRFMDDLGYNNNYDQFILAGSSLGFTQQKFKHWSKTLMDHMGIGLDLHDFREIIFIDHIDCGAYKKFYPSITNAEEEAFHHREHMQMARDKLALKFPSFEFRGYLMDLNGECTPIKVNESVKCCNEEPNESDIFLADIPTTMQKKLSFTKRHSLQDPDNSPTKQNQSPQKEVDSLTKSMHSLKRQLQSPTRKEEKVSLGQTTTNNDEIKNVE